MKNIKDYCKENGDLDEEKLTEDLTQLFVSIAYKENLVHKLLEKAEKEETFGIIIEYYEKRKELANEYSNKIKESEEK